MVVKIFYISLYQQTITIKQIEIMNDYFKGITLSKEELKALNGCIEMYIHNTQMSGCNSEKFQTLTNINNRLKEANK